MDKSLCFIIPAYNEELSIPQLVKEINDHFPKTTTIVINDCSTDSTSKIAKDLGVVVLDLENNLGIGGAVQTGLRFASENHFEVAVQIDGDGQHIVSEVHKLLSESTVTASSNRIPFFLANSLIVRRAASVSLWKLVTLGCVG